MAKRKNTNDQLKAWMDGISNMDKTIKYQMESNDYQIEDKAIKRQLEYAESLMERKFNDWEKQIFEWAYIQGKEDYKEGK